MVDSGDWLIPRLFIGVPDFQKPPLYYWMVSLVAELRGGNVGTLAVRIPAVLAGIAGLVIAFELGRRMFDEAVGIAAAVVLATTTRYAWLSRVGRIDMPLTLCCLVGLLCYWQFIKSGKSRPLSYWFYVCLGLGVLLKGPVAPVLIGLPMAVHFLLTNPCDLKLVHGLLISISMQSNSICGRDRW